MNILEAIVLGITQGLTEFLPVSSSGHLVLLQQIFGITEGNLFFAVMLHGGTLIAVIAVFRKEILEIILHPFSKLTLYLVLATIPTVVIAFLFKDFFDGLYGGKLLWLGFLLTTIVLFIAEKTPRGRKNINEMRPLAALTMGIMQGIAIIPGLSRSGSTIAGALFNKLDRSFAARFSFLMSIPVIIGSMILEGKDVLEAGALDIQWLPVIVGVLFAAVSGFIAIKFMLRLLNRSSLMGFAVYTAVLGVLILLDQYLIGLVF
ncbi:MAG: undecaprenyl-diphosphate phosphatase [Christensenellales bacterium]|jgi:undecaprenyl-diphosphatase